MDIVGILLVASDDFKILPQLRGWIAAPVGIGMAIGGAGIGLLFADMASTSKRNRRLFSVLAWTFGALVFLGFMIAIARTCGEPCENFEYAPNVGTYCAD